MPAFLTEEFYLTSGEIFMGFRGGSLSLSSQGFVCSVYPQAWLRKNWLWQPFSHPRESGDFRASSSFFLLTPLRFSLPPPSSPVPVPHPSSSLPPSLPLLPFFVPTFFFFSLSYFPPSLLPPSPLIPLSPSQPIRHLIHSTLRPPPLRFHNLSASSDFCQ